MKWEIKKTTLNILKEQFFLSANKQSLICKEHEHYLIIKSRMLPPEMTARIKIKQAL